MSVGAGCRANASPMRPTSPELPKESIEHLIFTIRGQRVILDADLARLYGVPTKQFNQAFKRNRDRFPSDFTFQLTAAEFAALNWSQSVTSSTQPSDALAIEPSQSRSATSSRKHRGAAYRPHAPLGSDVARCTERYRRDQRGRKRPAGILRFESRAAESRTNGIVSCMLRGRPGRFRGTGR